MNRPTSHKTLVGATTAILATLGIAASATFSVAGAASPRAGTIDVSEVGTISATNHSIVITGAFADSGFFAPPSSSGIIELHLANGTINIDDSRGGAVESRIYAHLAKYLNASTCGLSFSYSAPAPLVSGTGAYAGITGTVMMRTHDAGVFPKTTKGACNTNANPVGYLDIGMGSGSISFRKAKPGDRTLTAN